MSTTHQQSWHDAMRDPNAREPRTVLFADIVDSVATKEKLPEMSWVPLTGWTYDRVADAVREGGCGQIVKAIGDCVMVAYPDDDADVAIQDAIRIHEAVQQATRRNEVNIALTIGIATGSVVAFDFEPGGRDYLGLTVDKAARLCSAASAQGIFVDPATVSAARMNRISSEAGRTFNRSIDDYRGDLQRADAKGFTQPVEYYEILWAQQRFGIKSKVATAMSESRDQPGPNDNPGAGPAAPKAPGGAPAAKATRLRGSVFSWKDDKRCAFIDADNGQRYFTSDRNMVATEDYLEEGDVVFFCERAAHTPGKLPVATAVVAVGQAMHGTIVKALDGYGFARVADAFGNSQDVFVAFADAHGDLHVGDTIFFELMEGDRGPRAGEIKREGGPAAKAA